MREIPTLNNFEWSLKMALETPSEEYFSAEAQQSTNALVELVGDSPRNRLRIFCHDVENNKQIPQKTLRWLADAGRQYLEGSHKLVTALGLEKPDKTPRQMRRFHAGMRMFALMHCEGEKHDIALLQVKYESGLGDRNIQSSYAEVRDCAKAFGWCKKTV